MLELFDRDFKRIAILENAFNIKEDIKINSINYLNFDIPKSDLKTELIRPFFYVKSPRGLYRVMPITTQTDEVDILSIECEHVISTLIDDVMFGNVVIGNLGIYTREVIEFVLSKQSVKRWQLGRCDFSRQFEYLWEYENLASAIFSIPKPISNYYKWEYETDEYPWTLNLVKINEEQRPKTIISAGKNQLRLSKEADTKQLFTRIYPLGYGEGVNQLTIKDVNNGVPYLQADKSKIEKYGIISRTWIDRRYENPQSLKDAAQTMLDNYSTPLLQYDIDYTSIDDREHIEIGDKIRIIEGNDFYDDVVVGLSIDYGEIDKSKITLANKASTLASTIADLADRQRIEMTYSQGATQLYSQSLQVNADSNHGAVLNFFIPEEMRVVNKVVAKIRLDSFRAYSQATQGGGYSTESTSSGGGGYTSESTSSGGGAYDSTGGGGGDYRDTEAYKQYDAGMERVYTKTQNGIDYSRWIDIYVVKSHSHGFTIPNHNHSFSVSSHSHSVGFNIKSHTHGVTIPNHTHDIKPGIFMFGSPSFFTLKVNGKVKEKFYSTSEEIDITEYLLDDKKRISRGSWQSVEIVPNDLAYISIDLMLQGFVQSRGDYTV